MKTNGVRAAKFSHHVMMAAIGMTKASARRKKEKDPLDGEAVAKEVLTWRPIEPVSRFNQKLESIEDYQIEEFLSSVGWKLRNKRVRALFAHRKVVYFDAPE